MNSMCGLSDMHIAILVTNTDFSDFAKARPLDDEKFATLIADVRPDWTTTAFWVCKDAFPDDWSAFDGALITGSPASAGDGAPWMLRLELVIRQLVEDRVPLFGACFGHQIIAKAFGAPIARNPLGWSHGLIDMVRVGQTAWAGQDSRFALYGSHIEQVAALPIGADRIFESPGCPIAGFALGQSVFTVQHHPEMTQEFIADLIDEYADYVGEAVTAEARASVANGMAHRQGFADEIAAFYEQARG